ncbi:MAG: hypothetical protein ACK55I_19500, partial [bacterium]
MRAACIASASASRAGAVAGADLGGRASLPLGQQAQFHRGDARILRDLEGDLRAVHAALRQRVPGEGRHGALVGDHGAVRGERQHLHRAAFRSVEEAAIDG